MTGYRWKGKLYNDKGATVAPFYKDNQLYILGGSGEGPEKKGGEGEGLQRF